MALKFRNIDDIIEFPDCPLTVQSTPINASATVGNATMTERTDVRFRDKMGELAAGIWESDAGSWQIMTDEDEYIRILRGEIRLTDEDGNTRHFKAGDSFLVPVNFKGTWESVVPVRKIFVSMRRNSH